MQPGVRQGAKDITCVLVRQGRDEAITSAVEQNTGSEVPTKQILIVLNPPTAETCAFVS